MDIKKTLRMTIILAATAFSSCLVMVDYSYFCFVLENQTSHRVAVEWDTSVSGEESFSLYSGGHTKITKQTRPSPVEIYSATITFDDGKVLKYSSQDTGRSLCNPECHISDERFSGTYLDAYSFTLTEEDYALAVMPSEE